MWTCKRSLSFSLSLFLSFRECVIYYIQASANSSSSSSSLNDASTTAVTCSLISRQTLSVFVRLLPPSPPRGIHFLLLLKQSFDVAEEELLDKQTDDDDDDDAKIVVMLSERAREIARVSREHVSFLRWLFVDKMEFFLSRVKNSNHSTFLTLTLHAYE